MNRSSAPVEEHLSKPRNADDLMAQLFDIERRREEIERERVVSPASPLANQEPSVASPEPPRLTAVNPVNHAALASRRSLVSQDSLVSQESTDGKWERPGMKLLGVRIPLRQFEKFDFWCSSRRLEKQYVIEQAIAAILDGRLAIDPPVSQANPASPADWLASLMINDEEGSNIISHYARVTGTEPRESDVAILPELQKFPIVAVKCGILMSVLRAKSRVNSLRYCLGAIEEAASGGVVDMNQYLQYLESKLRRKRAGK